MGSERPKGEQTCYSGLMTDLSLAVAGLPEREQTLILRSAAHIADESRLPAWAQLCNHVTDLDVARLIHAIERGTIVISHGAAWTDLTGELRARTPHLTRIVNECLRLGLVTRTSKQTAPDIWRTWLVAAPVHYGRSAGVPACHRGRTRPIRYRMSDDLTLIDCDACLRAHR
jgi:hypothetical protein